MLTRAEASTPSLEDQVMNEERLIEYDKKIERLLEILLEEKERTVFNMRVPCQIPFIEIGREMNITESDAKWTMQKAERKMAAFRRFLAFL
jgi:DNA-directed RNA polymerase specialized sigma subunit